MTISKDLFLAILSLDSYNRGYGAGISDGGADDNDGLGGEGSKIGTATVVRQSDVDAGTPGVTAGFYAISYTVGAGVEDLAAGTRVISYRGTDNFGAYNNISGANDVVNGWLGGAGSPTSQTSLALEFYKSVAGKSVFEGAADKTMVSGHSLGGGLAAFTEAVGSA